MLPLLEVIGLHRSFGPVLAPCGADLLLRSGEVLALVGNNGAGKSTLIKHVSGVYRTDAGEIRLNGAPLDLHGPADARRLGIETVYQDLALADDLSVGANVFLGREPVRRWLGLIAEARRETVGILLAAFAAFTALVVLSGPALALDKVTFGLNWLADAEAGGYYQAVVDGTYAKYGLDVTIKPSSPEGNGGMLLLAGKLDFFQAGDLLGDFLAEQRNIPIVAVAADFQKDPQIFMSHPGVGLDKWTDLPKAQTAYVSAGGLYSFYAWMIKAWGFSYANVKPYDFDSAPFIVDKRSIQEGYLTSEPYAVEHEGHFKPNVFLLADHGYSTYSSMIEARRDTVERNPDLVQRFVNASAIGWDHYLYGDNAKANEAIKRANPAMTDGQIAYSIAKLKEYGIVDSGDAKKLGIGAMTDARVKDFFDEMVKAGIVKPGTDYKKVYTLQFVNKGVGVGLGPK